MIASTEGFGICPLSGMMVRKAPRHQEEIVSQLLFGEVYKLNTASADGKWLHITMAADGYEGWIAVSQHQPVSAEYYQRYQENKHAFMVSTFGAAKAEGQPETLVSVGSVLPFYEGGRADLGVASFVITAGTVAGQMPVSITETARLFLGAPYLWGGRSLFGVDCSGLVQQLFKMHGMQLRRDAYQQAEYGKGIHSLSQAQPGDLAFFEKNGRVDHVGLLLPGHKIIHAFGKVRIDQLDEKGILNADSGAYSHFLSFIRRIELA